MQRHNRCLSCTYWIHGKRRYCRLPVSCRRGGYRYCWIHAQKLNRWTREQGVIRQDNPPDMVVCFIGHQGVWHPKAWEAWRDQYHESHPQANRDSIQFVVHADQRIRYGRNFTNRYRVLNPIATTWGGASIVTAIIHTLKSAISMWPNALRFVVLTGDAMPIARASSYIQNTSGENGEILNMFPHYEYPKDTDMIQSTISTDMPSILRDQSIPLICHSLEMVLNNQVTESVSNLDVEAMTYMYGDLDHDNQTRVFGNLGAPDEFMIGSYIRNSIFTTIEQWQTNVVNLPIATWLANDAMDHIRAIEFDINSNTRMDFQMVTPIYSDSTQFYNVERGLTGNHVRRMLLGHGLWLNQSGRPTLRRTTNRFFLGDKYSNYFGGFLTFRKITPAIRNADSVYERFWNREYRL